MTGMSTCSSCGRPPENVCQPCLAGNPPAGRAIVTADANDAQTLQQVRRELADIPDLMVEASHYVIPGSAPADPEARASTGIPSHRLVIAPDIVDLLDPREKDMEPDSITENRFDGHRRIGVPPTITMWCQLLYVELEDIGTPAKPCCPRDQHTLARECTWLSDHAADAARLHDDFTAEIHSMWTDLRRACRITQPYIPVCTACGHRLEGQYADGESTDISPAWWRCTGCGNTVQHEAEIRRMALTQPPLTLRQLTSLLNIPLRTLYRWESEGRFLPVKRNSRGGKLYEVEHVRRAREKMSNT